MLTTLRVTNLAVVDELEIEFGPGLNVMTGETGSGKSVILRALELLSGKRAVSDLIRHGQERCVVEGIFILPNREELRERIRSADESVADLIEGEELIVRRVLEKSGRGKVYVNGGLIGSQALHYLGDELFDITGQHQQQTLLDQSKHLHLLDLFGVPEKLRLEMRTAFERYSEARDRYERFSTDSAQQAVDCARYQEELAELDAAGLASGRRTELEQELHRLAHTEVLLANIQRAFALLEGDEHSIDAQLREVLGVVERNAGIDRAFSAVTQLLEAAAAQLAESGIALSQIGSRLEVQPERLEELREQIAEIARLERKYGRKEAALLGYREEVRAKLELLGGGELSLEKLQGECEANRREAERIAKSLGELRERLAKELSGAVAKELGRLSMKRAQFQVSREPKELSGTGSDSVEFLFSANPGEPQRPLHKVASGGELSRVLLVLKTLLNERNLPSIQVFDEIDSGVSGAVSQVVGEKLLAVAQRCQVILVTHSPQIASLADTHFLIEKLSTKNTTRTSIRQLNRAERIEQLAAMLAGKEVSTHFQKSAEELLNVRSKLDISRTTQ